MLGTEEGGDKDCTCSETMKPAHCTWAWLFLWSCSSHLTRLVEDLMSVVRVSMHRKSKECFMYKCWSLHWIYSASWNVEIKHVQVCCKCYKSCCFIVVILPSNMLHTPGRTRRMLGFHQSLALGVSLLSLDNTWLQAGVACFRASLPSCSIVWLLHLVLQALCKLIAYD